MAFIASNEEKRTFDSERELELVSAGGGRGYRNFVLRGPNFEVGFSGHTESVPVEGVNQSQHAAASKILVWHIFNQLLPIPGRSIEETREMITEALTAFKGVHGYPAGQAVRVNFSRKTVGF